jgi:hypothetical protein
LARKIRVVAAEVVAAVAGAAVAEEAEGVAVARIRSEVAGRED